MPYIATLLVLVVGGVNRTRRHQNAPAALGEPFSRGER